MLRGVLNSIAVLAVGGSAFGQSPVIENLMVNGGDFSTASTTFVDVWDQRLSPPSPPGAWLRLFCSSSLRERSCFGG